MMMYEKSNSEDMEDNMCANGMTRFPRETPISMAYVPFQCWEVPYDESTGFSQGTMFPSLDLPFSGGMNNGRK